MTMHPLTDPHGAQYPELDWRWVPLVVFAQYLDVHRTTAFERLKRREYGKWESAESGIRLYKISPTSRGKFEIRPGVVWINKRLGRYGAPGFDWRMLDGKVTLCMSPAQRKDVQAATVPPPPLSPMENLGNSIAQLVQQALIGTRQTVLEFPGLTVRK